MPPFGNIGKGSIVGNDSERDWVTENLLVRGNNNTMFDLYLGKTSKDNQRFIFTCRVNRFMTL